ncbi:MAG: GldG family protein [Lachnospiraceae bacterium]|nr:GldG family protein [Lachnospiraceae bacterium]
MKEMDKKSAVQTDAEENKIRQTADEVSKSILEDAENKDAAVNETENADAEKKESAEDGKKPKKEVGRKVKASFGSRKFKGGAYATALSAIVIVVLLLVNLIVGKLDLKIDVTSQSQFTITDTTKEFMKELKDDITIYYLVQPGGEVVAFTGLVEKYEGLSDHIKVEYKDPVQYPKFASQYTDETVTQNSILVVNDETGRAKYVDYYDMLITEFDYTTYQNQITGTDVEGQITSAIQYVTNEDLPVMYEVTGHGETAIGTSVAAILEKENITLSSLNTLTESEIPEDCDILLINGPAEDFMEDEITMIKEYLAAGGNAIIFAGYGTAELPNFCKLLEAYSVGVVDGLVVEGSSSNYMGQYPMMVVPDVVSHDITSSFRNQKYVLATYASGLEVLDGGRTTVEVTELLTTSDKAYSKVGSMDEMETLEKEDGDIEGPFSLGYYITEEYNGVETKVAVFAAYTMIADSIAGSDTLANADLFVNTINAITEQENAIYIPSVSLAVDSVTLTASQTNMWTAIYIVIIPAIIIVVGIVVTVKRRKK